MKIRNFIAPDMRQGMRLIREQLGPDAVILTSDRTDNGVLITAAIDFDAADAAAAGAVASPAAQARRPTPDTDAVNAALSEELRVLRRLLETQMAQLAWNEYSRHSPLLAELQREFSACGFDQAALETALREFPENLGYSAAKRLLMLRIADRIRAESDRWMRFGGRLLLLGRSGAGKSSTALQLAARWVQRHGNRDVALVSVDDQALSSAERFARHARLLGVAGYLVSDPEQLAQVLDAQRERRLVIIDSAGIGAPGARGALPWRRIAAEHAGMEPVLVAAAGTQPNVQARLLHDEGLPRFSSAVITRLDECERIGGLLALLLRHDVPLSYVSRGRRWLRDFLPARGGELVALALGRNSDTTTAATGAAEVA